MAGKKTTKKAVETAPTKALTNEQVVQNKYKKAQCKELRGKFYIFCPDMELAVHSGLAKNEGDAWKLAAKAVL